MQRCEWEERFGFVCVVCSVVVSGHIFLRLYLAAILEEGKAKYIREGLDDSITKVRVNVYNALLDFSHDHSGAEALGTYHVPYCLMTFTYSIHLITFRQFKQISSQCWWKKRNWVVLRKTM